MTLCRSEPGAGSAPHSQCCCSDSELSENDTKLGFVWLFGFEFFGLLFLFDFGFVWFFLPITQTFPSLNMGLKKRTSAFVGLVFFEKPFLCAVVNSLGSSQREILKVSNQRSTTKTAEKQRKKSICKPHNVFK